MTKREACVLEVYTGISFVDVGIWQYYMEFLSKLMGKTVEEVNAMEADGLVKLIDEHRDSVREEFFGIIKNVTD